MDEILVHAYAPPLVAGDPRPEETVRAIEAAFEGVRLTVELAEQRDGSYVQVLHESDRPAYLASEIEDGKIPFITNPEEGLTVTLSSFFEHGVLAPGGDDQLHVVLCLPAEPRFVEACRHGLGRVATALGSHWATASLSEAHAVMTEQYVSEGSGERPPHDLPALRPGYELASPDVPQWLAWINFWSARCASLLAFPAAERDQQWVRRSHREGDAWIVALSDEPIDFSRPEHARIMREAYQRFAPVGRLLA